MHVIVTVAKNLQIEILRCANFADMHNANLHADETLNGAVNLNNALRNEIWIF